MNGHREVPILYYHSVGKDSLSVQPAVFRAQLRYLKDHSYSVVGVKQWLARAWNASILEKYVALTFDDGFESVLENALPALKEFGYSATFFIVPGYVGTTLWGDPRTKTWSGEKRPGRIACPMMTWNQIAELSAAGMEIGSHTLSHPNLTDISKEEAKREICDSKTFLEEKLGIAMQGFCYPRGRQNDGLANLVQQSGYRYGCTTTLGYATPDMNRFLLPRVPGPASLSDLIFRMKGFSSNVFTYCVLRVARNLEQLKSAVLG